MRVSAAFEQTPERAPWPAIAVRVCAAVEQALQRAPWLFGLSIAFLLARVLLIPDPIFMPDEYFYAKTTQLWAAHEQGTRLVAPVDGRGGGSFPNSLYFAIYSVVYRIGGNFYTASKLLNVLFATIAVLGIWRVAAHFIERRAALLVATLALWMPSTVYLSYFMPEALYDSLVWWGLAMFMLTVERDLRVAAAWLGAFLGAALLAKPNAVAVLGASHLVIALVAWRALPPAVRGIRALAACVAMDLAFAATGYALNVVLTGHWHWDPVGSFYVGGLAQVGAVETNTAFVTAFGRYVFVCLYALLFAFGSIAVVLCAAGLPAHRSARSTALWGYAVIGTGVLLLGTAKVGVNWERVFENHIGVYCTRYMSVLFPLLVIAFKDSLAQAAERARARRLWGIVLGATLLALAYACRDLDNTTQLPEIVGTSGLYSRLYAPTLAAGFAALLYYAWARRPRPQMYLAFIVVYALVSAAGLTRQDLWRGRADRTSHADIARTVRMLVAPGAQDQGVIVAVRPLTASRIATTFPGFVPMQIVAAETRLPRAALMGAPRWALFVDGALPGFDARCVSMESTFTTSASAETRARPSQLCEILPGGLR